MFGNDVLPSHKQRIAQLDAKYQADIDRGVFKPYIYPLCAAGVFAVFVYFLIPHRDRPLLRRSRFLVWTANLVFSLYIIFSRRARRAPIDYGVGLITWWFVLWTTAVMLAYDGQLEFARIERSIGATKTLPGPQQRSNGTAAESKAVCESKPSRGNTTVAQLRWQPYPTNAFIERVDWVIDLLSNFRGMTWNWRIPNLPPPPIEIQGHLKENKDSAFRELSRSKLASQPMSRQTLLKDAAKRLVIGYLCLDFIRTLTIHDPYFRGLGSQYAPEYLPSILRGSPVFLQAFRLLIALFAIYWALATIFVLAPLFFCGILGADLIGVRGEPWAYPTEWGSYTAVLDKGLAAWWSTFWHQTFRFAFEAPSRRILDILEVDRRSNFGRLVQLLIAFALSGSIHASGSYTSIGDTRPLRGPFLFFIMQPFGIMIQMFIAKQLRRADVFQRMPAVVRQASNFVFVHLWFYFTAPIFIEDLAKGGTFMYEPVPFSIFRLLGLGGRDESSICWTLPITWLGWHNADKWWDSGLST